MYSMIILFLMKYFFVSGELSNLSQSVSPYLKGRVFNDNKMKKKRATVRK
jgi:hypothetical protein